MSLRKQLLGNVLEWFQSLPEHTREALITCGAQKQTPINRFVLPEVLGLFQSEMVASPTNVPPPQGCVPS